MIKRFPAVTIGFQVVDPKNNKTVHRGKYHLENDNERRAFGERCHDAMIDGYEIRSKMIEDRRQFGALQELKGNTK